MIDRQPTVGRERIARVIGRACREWRKPPLLGARRCAELEEPALPSGGPNRMAVHGFREEQLHGRFSAFDRQAGRLAEGDGFAPVLEGGRRDGAVELQVRHGQTLYPLLRNSLRISAGMAR